MAKRIQLPSNFVGGFFKLVVFFPEGALTFFSNSLQ